MNDDNAGVMVINGTSAHDHDSDDEMIQSDAFREEVKKRVREDPSRPIKRAYDATAASAARGGYLRLNRHSVPEFHKIRSSVSRAKQEEVPRIPRTINDVDITGVWAETWNGDNFLLYSDNAWGIVVFATNENLTVLQQCRDLYVDGTFRTVPKPFYQYVTIHGNFRGRIIPLVGALLSGKTTGHYREVLKTVKIHVQQVTGQRFKPGRIICDFELAIITAVETELRHCRVSACAFHFRQSLYRKLNELGLSRAYKHDLDFRHTISKFMSMGFLPLQLVRNNFLIFSTSQTVRGLAQQYPELNRFVAYVDNTYIRGRFNPSMWNVFLRNRRNRTNNAVEGTVVP